MIIYIYLVFFHHCLKFKMAAGSHFENKIWSLFFNATIWFGQFQAKKKSFFAIENFFVGGLRKFLEIFGKFLDFFCVLSKCHFVIYVYCSLKSKKMLLCLKIALSQGCSNCISEMCAIQPQWKTFELLRILELRQEWQWYHPWIPQPAVLPPGMYTTNDNAVLDCCIPRLTGAAT